MPPKPIHISPGFSHIRAAHRARLRPRPVRSKAHSTRPHPTTSIGHSVHTKTQLTPLPVPVLFPPPRRLPRHHRAMPGGRKRPTPFAGFSPFARSLIFSAATSSCPKSRPLPDASTAAETPRQGTPPLVPDRVTPTSPLLESRHSMHASLACQTTCRGRRPSA